MSLSPPVVSTCPFCNAQSDEVFRATVMYRHQAIYAECTVCRSLHVVDPTWLDEAYANPDFSDELDSGAPWRNATLAGLLVRLGTVAPVGPWLDYGSGRGLLVERLAGRGFQIQGHDPHRGIVASMRTAFAMISAFEVLEHSPTPLTMMRELRDMLEPSGIVVLSTWLREPVHGSGWRYLATAAGQHVSFPSLQGLQRVFHAAGLSWWCSGANREHAELQVHLGGTGETRGVEQLERSGFTVFARA